MSTDDAKLFGCGFLWLCSLVVVFYAGYMTRDSLTRPEDTSYRPEVIQADGSVVLERDPAPAASLSSHQLPKGAVEERRVTVTVKPDPVSRPEHPKPVRIDLSLIRDTEGGRRVVASAAGGQIVGGMDIPIRPLEVPVRRLWAAGASFDPFTESPGIWAERDYGRIRAGLDLYQDRAGAQTGMAARVRIGWTF